MKLDKNIESRVSCKSFLQAPVEWDKLVKILQAGSLAPSAGNLQNWKFVVVQEKSNRDKIADACLFQTWMTTAPLYIVVCGNPEISKKYYFERGPLFTIQSCAAAMQNMLIEITNQELGANWVGAFDTEKLHDLIGVKDGWIVYGILTVGYKGDELERPNKMDLKDQVYFEKFGKSKYENPLFPVSGFSAGRIVERVKSEIKGELEKVQKKQNDSEPLEN